jgi:hypothetical protein
MQVPYHAVRIVRSGSSDLPELQPPTSNDQHAPSTQTAQKDKSPLARAFVFQLPDDSRRRQIMHQNRVRIPSRAAIWLLEPLPELPKKLELEPISACTGTPLLLPVAFW